MSNHIKHTSKDDRFLIQGEAGSKIDEIIRHAHRLAVENNAYIITDSLNGVVVEINPDSDVDTLISGWREALDKGYPRVGAYGIDLDDEERVLYEDLADANSKYYEAEHHLSSCKRRLQNYLVEKVIKDVEYDHIDDGTAFNEWKENNCDGYGRSTVVFADKFGRYMQAKIKNFDDRYEVQSIVKDAQYYDYGVGGLSGFQFKTMLNILRTTWKHFDKIEWFFDKKK